MAELFAKRRLSQEEISVLPGSSFCRDDFYPFEQLQDNVLLSSDLAEHIHHVGSTHDMHSANPLSRHSHEQRDYDVTKPRIAVCKKIGKYTRTQFTGPM